MLLVVLPEAEPVVRARRDQERRGERRAQERGEVDAAVAGPELAEAPLEREHEQEGEEHLHARERDAQLVEKLDELAVEAFVVVLFGHGGRRQREYVCSSRQTRHMANPQRPSTRTNASASGPLENPCRIDAATSATARSAAP